MASAIHRLISKFVQHNLVFDVKGGNMSCKKCFATCKLHDPLDCAFQSVDNSSPCLLHGLTYSDAKDLITDR